MKENIYVPMGEYCVVNKRPQSSGQIITANVQTCVAVVLTTSTKIAVMHFDIPVGITAQLETVIAELREDDPNARIQVEIIGGDHGFPGDTTSSSYLYEPIKNYFSTRPNISWKYERYGYSPNTACATVLGTSTGIGCFLWNYGINPVISLFACVGVCAVTACSPIRSRNFDVQVSLKTGEIKVTADNLDNTRDIMKASSELRRRTADRSNLNPRAFLWDEALVERESKNQPITDRERQGRELAMLRRI